LKIIESNMRAMVPERLDAYLAGTNTKASHTADR
jgi:hypothetical protein